MHKVVCPTSRVGKYHIILTNTAPIIFSVHRRMLLPTQAFLSIDSLLVISTPKHPLMIQRALYYSVGKPDLAELSGACSKQAKKERRPMHSATSAMRRGKFVAHSLAASLSSGFQSLLWLDKRYNHLGADSQYAFFSFRYRMTHLVS